MCSKLFRPNKCAVREFLTRNSHGETKIVLDPGTRSGLSSRCIFLKDENFKSSCGSIDSRREPAWAGADHHHVAHVGLIDSGVQSEAGSHFGIAWIAQGDCAATNQDRNVRYRNFELVKNSLHVRIDLDIKIAVRLTVASKKFSETQRVTRMVGSDQHRIANGVGNEKNAAQYKRLQEYLPERGIRLHNVAKIGSVDFQQRAGIQGPGADQGPAARQQVHISGEFSAVENVENSFALGGNTNYFDPATQYDEDAVMQIAPFQYDFVRLRIPLLTKCCQPSNLTVVKLGEPCFDLFGRSSRYQFTSRHRFFLCVQRILQMIFPSLPPSIYVADFEFDDTPFNGCRATSEYSRRYLRKTSCKDPAIRTRYGALPVRCPASGTGETEGAAQYRIRRSPLQRVACSATR